MGQISVEIIQKCPNRCLHCSSLADSSCILKIETDQMKKVIDSAAILRTEVLSISGGEPFLHNDLLEIAAYAKAKGIAVYIYTCGVVFDGAGRVGSISEEMLRELYAIAVDKIIFDIPAVSEDIYDRFMGSTGYQGFAFESLHAACRAGLCTEIHFVPTKINLGEKLAQIADQQIRIGIPLQLEDSEYCCYAGKNKLCVRYDGLVFGCEAFKYVQLHDCLGHMVQPDSIYNMALENIYTDSEYLKLEREFVAQYLSDCSCGEKCPVQKMLRAKPVA